MSKKLVFCLALLTIGVWILGCMPPPFYGTAQIDPGFHWDAGVAVGGGILLYEEVEGLGGGVSTELRYGFNEYVQWHARAGVDTYSYIGSFLVVPRIGMGIQTALPLEVVTPAFRLEAAGIWPLSINPALLLGIGRNETATLGGRLHIFPPPPLWPFLIPDAFITGHLWSRLSIFAGVGLFHFDEPMLHGMPVFTLGVGYKIK